MNRGSWLGAAVVLGAVLGAAAPAAAQTPDDSGCHMVAGTLECGAIQIHGTLRNIVMVSFERAPLGIRLLELRQSFLDDIVRSVQSDPF